MGRCMGRGGNCSTRQSGACSDRACNGDGGCDEAGRLRRQDPDDLVTAAEVALLRLLEVADIGPPSSQESIVRASRCNRTNQGSLWARAYGSSRDSYAYYHGERRDCTSQPMLMRRRLRSGALLAEGSVELTPGSDRALVVADARFQAEGTFEVRCANQSGRVREGFGVVGPKRAGDDPCAATQHRGGQ